MEASKRKKLECVIFEYCYPTSNGDCEERITMDWLYKNEYLKWEQMMKNKFPDDDRSFPVFINHFCVNNLAYGIREFEDGTEERYTINYNNVYDVECKRPDSLFLCAGGDACLDTDCTKFEPSRSQYYKQGNDGLYYRNIKL